MVRGINDRLKRQKATGSDPALDEVRGLRVAPGANIATDAHFEFVQATPSASWVVAHNLNKLPSVVLLDGTGGEVFADIVHVDSNNLTVNFGTPQTGKAILN